MSRAVTSWGQTYVSAVTRMDVARTALRDRLVR
jgi:hypothetical protein